jgi:hypothetical protein
LLWYTLAPSTTPTGTQLNVENGYVVWSLSSQGEEQGFESSLETYRLTFVAYRAANTEKVLTSTSADSAAVIRAIRFNGQPVASVAGFENRATLPGLTDVALLGIFPEGPPETVQETRMSQGGYPAFRTTMNFRVEVERT